MLTLTRHDDDTIIDNENNDSIPRIEIDIREKDGECRETFGADRTQHNTPREHTIWHDITRHYTIRVFKRLGIAQTCEFL